MHVYGKIINIKRIHYQNIFHGVSDESCLLYYISNESCLMLSMFVHFSINLMKIGET
jgi:hypothetical protein